MLLRRLSVGFAVVSAIGALGALPFFGALGCNSGKGDRAAPIARVDYCTTVAKSNCARLVGCCNTAGITADDDTCQSREVVSCEVVAQQAEAKGYLYDPQAAGSCLAGSHLFYDGCASKQPAYWASRATVEACAQVFHGGSATGGACTTDQDCAPMPDSIAACRRTSSTSTSGKPITGECIAIPRANVGQTCSLAPDDSAAFVGCGDDAICASLPSSTGATPPTHCLKPAEAGQACNLADPRTCNDGLICDPARSLCAPPAALGERCGAIPCAAPNICQWTSSLCVAKIAIGASCRDSDVCVDGAGCVDGTCEAQKLEGASCVLSEECLSRYCQFAGLPNGQCGKVYGSSAGGVDLDQCRGIAK